MSIVEDSFVLHMTELLNYLIGTNPRYNNYITDFPVGQLISQMKCGLNHHHHIHTCSQTRYLQINTIKAEPRMNALIKESFAIYSLMLTIE